MGRYISCSGESAVSTCDPYNWDCKKITAAAAAAAPNTGSNKPESIRKFRRSELVAATGGFSADSFLGKGSHGSVYRAALDGGKLIAAVKRAKLNAFANFYQSEIEILSRVRGPRLVNLIGVCDGDEATEQRLIVVEYMPNGCLYDLLHTSPRPLGWSDRVRFALQVAKAVRGLHELEPPVMHRDIKSSNVLIDGKWNARLGDFGLALRGHVEDVRARSTPPAGTMGYLDPAYTAPADLSEKSDVFSFGILLLEIISGRNAIDVNYSPPSIVDWAVPLIKLCRFGAICDSRIGVPMDPAIVHLMAVLAAWCVRSDARRRPSMVEVVERLQITREKVRATRLWGNWTRRAIRIDTGKDAELAIEVETKVGCNKRLGNGSRNRKVSSVSTLSAESGRDGSGVDSAGHGGRRSAASGANHHVVRSRSVGPASSCARRRQAERGVVLAGNRWAVAGRLNKSRSVGAHALDYSPKGVVFGGAHRPVAGGNDQSDWTVKSDIDNEEESDNKLLEKPLVATVN